MARIRTIKPEFPQSESLARCSRDARLLFISLWTICDDAGRTRGASQVLASFLFPFDADARTHIDKWLSELEDTGHITRYAIGDTAYLQVNNWLKHQKIDRPTTSRIPAPDVNSRPLAKPREDSMQDLGPRTLDLGKKEAPLPPKLQAGNLSAELVPDSETGEPTFNGWRIVRVFEKATEIARIDPTKNPSVTWEPLIRWFRDEIEPDRIYAAIKRCAERADYRPPRTLAWFDRAVREQPRMN